MQRMHPKAVRLSIWTALVTHLLFSVSIIVWLIFALIYEWTMIPLIIAAVVTLLSGFTFTSLVPSIRAKHFAYEVEEEEIRISKGIFWISDILIPMVKVQHVELESGPLMRKSDIAHVTIVTAATKHRIYGLERENAESLQRLIAQWARVREDDV